MIKLINCWMSALKSESLRHGSRKAVAMRCADNKPCTKKKWCEGEILGKQQKMNGITASPLQLKQPYTSFFRQPSAKMSAILIRNVAHSHQKKPKTRPRNTHMHHNRTQK